MARKFVEPGQVIDYINLTGATIVVDSAVPFGHQLGVALTTMDNGQSGRLALEGVFRDLPKVSTAVWSRGDSLMWDASAGALNAASAVPAVDDIMGAATALTDATDGQTTCTVKLGAGLNAAINIPSVALAPTFTGRQHDYTHASLAGAREIRWTGAAFAALTGIAAQADGKEIILSNDSVDYPLVLEHENTDSVAANRLALPGGDGLFVLPGDSVTFRYSSTRQRWVVISAPNIGEGMGFERWSDFLVDGGGFLTGLSGAGAVCNPASGAVWNSTNRQQGIIYHGTGTTATGYAALGFITNRQVVSRKGQMLIGSKVSIDTAPDGTETFTVYVGLMHAPGAVTDAVAWEYRWNGSAPELSRLAVDNSNVTRETSGNPTFPTLTDRCFVVYLNPAWTRADYLYSTDNKRWNLAGSGTVNIPADGRAIAPMISGIVKSAGLTSRVLRADWGGIRHDLDRAL